MEIHENGDDIFFVWYSLIFVQKNIKNLYDKLIDYCYGATVFFKI